MKNLYINKYYYLFAEYILAFLIFQPIFAIFPTNNEFSHYGLVFLVGISIVYITLKSPSVLKMVLISSYLTILLIGYIINLNIFILLFLSLYVLVRTRSVLKNDYEEGGNKLLFATFMTGFVILIINMILKLDNEKDIIWTIASVYTIQLFYILVGGYVKNIVTHQIDSEKSKYIIPLSIIMGIFTGTVAVLLLLRDLFFKIFFLIIDGIFFVFGFALTPLLKLLDIELEPKTDIEGPMDVSFAEGIAQEEITKNNEHVFLIALAIVLAILAILIIWLVYRYIKKKNEGFELFSEQNEYETFVKDYVTPISLFNNKNSEPKDAIRKEVYALEKFAHKKKVSRQKGESIRKWFERLSIDMPESFYVTYEKVRYGEGTFNQNEYQQFAMNVKKVKEQLKNISKDIDNNKDKGFNDKMREHRVDRKLKIKGLFNRI